MLKMQFLSFLPGLSSQWVRDGAWEFVTQCVLQVMLVRPPHPHSPPQHMLSLVLQAGEYMGAAKIFKLRGTCSNGMRSGYRRDFWKVLLDLAIVSTGQKSVGNKENSCRPLLGMSSAKGTELKRFPCDVPCE